MKESIISFFMEKFQPMEAELYRMCVDYIEERLAGTSEDNPLECDITLELGEPHGWGIEAPCITAAWLTDSGAVNFLDGDAEVYIEDYGVKELIQLVDQL